MKQNLSFIRDIKYSDKLTLYTALKQIISSQIRFNDSQNYEITLQIIAEILEI